MVRDLGQWCRIITLAMDAYILFDAPVGLTDQRKMTVAVKADLHGRIWSHVICSTRLQLCEQL